MKNDRKEPKIISFSEMKNQRKLQKKAQVLLDYYIQQANLQVSAQDQKQACVIETIDGHTHHTTLDYFDERGLYCSRNQGHCEFFDYHYVKNIF